MKHLYILFFILLISTAQAAEEVFTYQNNGFTLGAAPASSGTSSTMLIRTIPCYHISCDTAAETLKKCYPWATVTADKDKNQLIVKASTKYITAIEALIQQLDAAPAQISLEAQIVEISESGLQQLGILWNVTQEGLRIGKNETDVEGVLKTLEGKGQAKILATPKITTVENKEAFVRIGDRIPYAVPVGTNATDTRWSIQYLDAGIILSIKPTLGASDNIQIELHPEVINLKEWKPTPAGDFPILSSREAKTLVETKSGNTIAIAGLRNEETKENVTKIPLLGDIPLLGELFTYRSKEKVQTEIVFLITPTLLKR